MIADAFIASIYSPKWPLITLAAVALVSTAWLGRARWRHG